MSRLPAEFLGRWDKMSLAGTAALTAEGLSELSHETAESNLRAVELFERALGLDARSAAA